MAHTQNLPWSNHLEKTILVWKGLYFQFKQEQQVIRTLRFSEIQKMLK